MKCSVANCTNHSHQGSFRGTRCVPCADYIEHGRGTCSQAYRNRMQAKEPHAHACGCRLAVMRLLPESSPHRYELTACPEHRWLYGQLAVPGPERDMALYMALGYLSGPVASARDRVHAILGGLTPDQRALVLKATTDVFCINCGNLERCWKCRPFSTGL